MSNANICNYREFVGKTCLDSASSGEHIHISSTGHLCGIALNTHYNYRKAKHPNSFLQQNDIFFGEYSSLLPEEI